MIEEILFNILLRFRVVHSIPGRLRINIPHASKIPAEWKPDDSELDFLRQIDGIRDFSFSYITGNALIHYNPSVISEEEIIATFRHIGKVLAQHRQEIKQISRQKEPAAARLYLIQLVRQHLCPEPPSRKDDRR